MRIPYGFELISDGTLEVNKDEANIVSMIFDFYMACLLYTSDAADEL